AGSISSRTSGPMSGGTSSRGSWPPPCRAAIACACSSTSAPTAKSRSAGRSARWRPPPRRGRRSRGRASPAACAARRGASAGGGVRIVGDRVALQTIGDAPPIGLCGSGLVDAVAQLYRAGLLDAGGRLRSEEEAARAVPPALAKRLITLDGVRAFVLAPAGE